MSQVLTVDEALQEGNTASAFVLLPSGPAFDDLFRDLIAPTLEATGYSARRFLPERDRQPRLIDEITRADLVIADVSDSDDAVMYGLGLARGLARPAIVLAQHRQAVPAVLDAHLILVHSPLPRELAAMQGRLRDLVTQAAQERAILGNAAGDLPRHQPGTNPWLATAGMFADDPRLLPMLEEIYAEREADRQTMDAEG
jgi:hypothetical protein